MVNPTVATSRSRSLAKLLSIQKMIVVVLALIWLVFPFIPSSIWS